MGLIGGVVAVVVILLAVVSFSPPSMMASVQSSPVSAAYPGLIWLKSYASQNAGFTIGTIALIVAASWIIIKM